jgi:hypothetical protein
LKRLPLPAAHLVIDIRAASDQRCIDWLRIELEDLVNEAKSRAVPRWQIVGDCLSFLHLPPDAGSGYFPEDDGEPEEATAASLLLARQQSCGQEDTGAGGQRPSFAHQRDQLVQEIERLRGNRARAMQEASEMEQPLRGHDARVRVFFLVDLNCQEVLSSALLWAKHLKNHYRKHTRPGRRPGLCVALVCLGDVGEGGNLGLLIQELDNRQAGAYLDTLILSENFRCGPPLAGRAQACIAAQLLYALFMFFSPSFTFFSSDPAVPPSAGAGARQPAVWPEQTYLVHIAALEYPARWGRRWLNNGLAHVLVDTLHPQAVPSEPERIRAADLGIGWFYDWWGRLRESMPCSCDLLANLQRVPAVSLPVWPIFVAGRQRSRGALEALEGYLNRLAETYVATGSEPSLQAALLQGRSRVMQTLSESSGESQNDRSLLALRREARQIFRTPEFWGSANPPLACAPFFLEGLAGACADLQQTYLCHPLNPEVVHRKGRDIRERRQDFLDGSQRLLRELTSAVARWPGLTSVPYARRPLQYITFVLQAALASLGLFLGVAWLHHIALEHVPGRVLALDRSGVPWLDLGAIVLWVLLVCSRFRALQASFARKRARDIVIAGTCLLFLALLSLCGFLTGLQLTSLAHAPGDPTSIVYLAWLAPCIPIATWAPLIALTGVVLGEAIYFLYWSLQLRQQCQRVVRAWQQQQQQDVRDVIDCIAMDVALEVAQQAEICDRRGGPGNYFYRVRQLSDLLRSLAASAQQCHQLAAERLLLNQGDGEQGAEDAWVRAHRGQRELDVDILLTEYEKLCQQIKQDHALQRALAEYLLRAQGSEPPEELVREMHLSEVACAYKPVLRLVLSLVAHTTRNMLDPLPPGRIDLNRGEYQHEQRYITEEMPALWVYARALNAQVRQVIKPDQLPRPDWLSSEQAGLSVSVQLLALVAQLFWQQQGSEQLKQSLALKSIWEHLERSIPGQQLPARVVHRLKSYVGNGTRGGQRVDQYLLTATPSGSSSLSQELKQLMSSQVIAIPDQERLLLFGIRRVVAR